MDYNEFKDEILKKVEERLGIGMTVSVEKNIKNNGMILDGLIIRDKDYFVSPIQYLNHYYDKFKKGDSLEDCVNEIMLTNRENALKITTDFSYISNWNVVKDKVRLMLVNKEFNKEMLLTMPHEDFLDLAIIYYIEIESSELGQATIKITNQIFSNWKITYKKLYEAAYANIFKYDKPQINSMNNVMKDIFKNDFVGSDEEFDAIMEEMLENNQDDKMMYVLSNQSKIKGANAILCKTELAEFAKKVNKGFYILPSSIHELILILDDGDLNSNNLRTLVEEVNSSEVAKDEVLSNTVYYFNKEKSEVCVA